MRKIVFAAGIAAGLALLTPAVASAGTAPVKQTLSVTVSGNSITLQGTCAGSGVYASGDYGYPHGHEPLGNGGAMKVDGHRQTATFQNIKAGKYVAFMWCEDSGKSTVVDFSIPAAKKTEKQEPARTNQVAKKPVGAPQTGGGPADDSGVDPLLVAGGAVGVTAAAGAGFWLLRRRRASA